MPTHLSLAKTANEKLDYMFSLSSSHKSQMRTRGGHWRLEEDERLKELVTIFGCHDWAKISKELHGRSAKSCRLRWFKQLDPRINKDPFTEKEEELLLDAYRLYGNRWADIARLFDGRTDNMVKNRWHVIMAQRCKEMSELSATRSCRCHPRKANGGPNITRGSKKKKKQIKFYDFLQVNTNSGNIRAMARGEENGIAVREQRFIDFLGVGSSSI